MSPWGAPIHLACILVGVIVCALLWKRLSPFKVAGILMPCMVVGMSLEYWISDRPIDLLQTIAGGIVFFFLTLWALQMMCFEVTKADRKKLAESKSHSVPEIQYEKQQLWPRGAPLWERVIAGILIAPALLYTFFFA